MRKSIFGAATGLAVIAVTAMAAAPAEAGGRHHRHGHHKHGYYHGGPHAGAAILGLGVGAIIGSAIAAPPYAYSQTYYSPYAQDYPPYHSGYAYTYETVSPPAYYQPNYQAYSAPYPAPGYGAPSYGAPSYGAPSYSAPSYAAPAYTPPSAPSYTAPKVYSYPPTYKGAETPSYTPGQPAHAGQQAYGGYQGGGQAPNQGSSDWYAYCWSKYPDFDPKSGTYGGGDGKRHICR